MGLIKLGIVLYGIHLITNKIREDRKCGAGCGSPRNHHEDPSNNSLPNPKPPGSPQAYQQYPAPSQYQPQNTTYRDEKQLYSETPRMISDNQQIQMREAPTYDEATSNSFSTAAHECPNCGHANKKAVKN